MNYNIFLSSGAAKFLENLEKVNKQRIITKLRQLEDKPFSLPYKKIKGRDNTYRIRIGDFRVIYSVRDSEVRVLKIDWRRGVYGK